MSAPQAQDRLEGDPPAKDEPQPSRYGYLAIDGAKCKWVVVALRTDRPMFPHYWHMTEASAAAHAADLNRLA